QEQMADVFGQPAALREIGDADQRSSSIMAHSDRSIGCPEVTEKEPDLVVRQLEDLRRHELVVGTPSPQPEWLEPIADRMVPPMGDPVRARQTQMPGVPALRGVRLYPEQPRGRLFDCLSVGRVGSDISHGGADRAAAQ